jgi:putative transposase
MIDLFWLSEAQVRRIEQFFPLSHGVPRIDDRRVISGSSAAKEPQGPTFI